MGCFSWLCKECDKGIKSNSFSGEECYLFLLKGGKVIQRMEGQYNSYGCCFIPGTGGPNINADSYEWSAPELDIKNNSRFGDDDSWGAVCKLLFSQNPADGMAAYHKYCYKGVLPTTRSADDPNQGWGDADDDDLMGNCDPDYEYE